MSHTLSTLSRPQLANHCSRLNSLWLNDLCHLTNTALSFGTNSVLFLFVWAIKPDRRQTPMKKQTTTTPTRHHSHDVVAHAPRATWQPAVKPAAAAEAPKVADVENGEATLTLSAKTTKLIEGVREPFMLFVEDFTALSKNRAQLAPKFMKAFGAYQSESGGSFIAFVCYIDPTVPADREGYRNNTVYQAADYLRRLKAKAEKEEVADPNAPVVASPIDVIVDLLVTVIPVVESLEPIWAAFTERYHWTEKRIARLKKLVGESRTPLLIKHGQERRLHALAS